MQVRFWPHTLFPSRLFSRLLPHQRPRLGRSLRMVVTMSGSKRPTCPSCSKPASTCLCNRLRNPGLENKVCVTILQHSLERKHPLNSARIAKLGLKNVSVVTVSDANFGARFDIRLLEPGGNGNGSDSVQVLEFEETQKPGFVLSNGLGSGNTAVKNLEEKPCNLFGSTVECMHSIEPQSVEFLGVVKQPNSAVDNDVSALPEVISDNRNANTDENENDNEFFRRETGGFHEKPVITFTIDRYGYISSLTDTMMTETAKQKLEEILPSLPAVNALAEGFVVKKLQKMQLKDGMMLEECEEFELKVPAGSVLLFPSEKAIGVDGLQLNGFEVKNLIVLDGTWAKAKRMYNENPWLKLLPHLRLDLDKMSLYAEVRTQPKAGYLSTIESIVYAMKAIGAGHEELDDLLDVFESMVGDQRRCKDARLSKVAIG